ncbi:hypothetical protein ANCCAN_04420 [Ancylostoma caninum]|uniref:Uncharacterized protein n=1 Tax=Ancylostoma caninum TaxID=29170 RepID=A0A368H1J2_ANCCA|nr:hypothetical protein ANCCAN_04420 [Ancylostoma caninum]
MTMGPSDRRGFRDFDEDDLESYLEGSLWSERPCDGVVDGVHDGRIVTVFPCTSSDYLYGNAPRALETIFTSLPTVHANYQRSFYGNV